MAVPARYFDGLSGRAIAAQIAIGGDGIGIYDAAGAPLAHWPFADLRILPGASDDGRFTLATRSGTARAECDDPAVRAELRRRVRRIVRGPARRRGTLRVALWTGAAVTALGFMIFGAIPMLAERLAPRISPEVEIAMGEQVRERLAQFSPFLLEGEARVCIAPAGSKALDLMVARLEAHADLPYPLKVEVWQTGMVNAAALPGGHVLILDGLLEEAANADEVAGVLAHEIGHVAHLDGLRLSLRAAGSAGLLGLIVGDATGGAAAVVAAEQLLNARYTREAEAAADAYALDMLTSAGVDPDAFAGFFERLSEQVGETPAGLEHFATHPDLAGRAADARAHPGPPAPRPVLTETQWQALKDICSETAVP